MRILVDGMMLVYKTLYKLDWLHTSRGIQTGMEYGFLRTLQSMKQFDRQIVICWDSRSIRHNYYDGYKNSRNGGERRIDKDRLDDFVEVLKMVYHWSKKEGLEADDIFASLVQPGDWIYTRDKDMFQLVTEDIKILYTWTHQLILWDRNYVYTKFGVWPEHMPMFQALTGDACDSVPGCKGIRKGDLAWAIVNNDGVLDRILYDDKRIDGKDLLSLREFVASGDYERNLKLVTLIRDPDVTIQEPHWDAEAMKAWFQRMEIFSLDLCQKCGFMPEF